MCHYFYNNFFDYIFNNKRLINITCQFSRESFKENDKKILEHFR